MRTSESPCLSYIGDFDNSPKYGGISIADPCMRNIIINGYVENRPEYVPPGIMYVDSDMDPQIVKRTKAVIGKHASCAALATVKRTEPTRISCASMIRYASCAEAKVRSLAGPHLVSLDIVGLCESLDFLADCPNLKILRLNTDRISNFKKLEVVHLRELVLWGYDSKTNLDTVGPVFRTHIMRLYVYGDMCNEMLLKLLPHLPNIVDVVLGGKDSCVIKYIPKTLIRIGCIGYAKVCMSVVSDADSLREIRVPIVSDGRGDEEWYRRNFDISNADGHDIFDQLHGHINLLWDNETYSDTTYTGYYCSTCAYAPASPVYISRMITAMIMSST